MTKKLLLLLALCLIVGFSAKAGTKEVYSSFKESKGTLTYYYDDQRAARESSGEVTVIYNPDVWGFKDFNKKVTVAAIDASMADASLQSTKKMFFQLNNIEEIQNIENLITDNVVNMDSMFYGCSSLTSLDVSHFKTTKVTSMASMFSSCGRVRTLDVSSFSTTNVTNMRNMFDGCGMTSLDLSNFNTSKVTNMREMFSDCHLLKYLDISSFDISNVEDINKMFLRCHQLVTIHCEKDWSSYTPNQQEGLFGACYLLFGDKGTECDGMNNVGLMYARLDGLDGQPGYFSTKNPTLQPIVYTEYDKDANTLTYFYDNEYGTREGVIEKYNSQVTRFDTYNESVNIAIIDPSMKNANLSTTSRMFYGDENHTLKNMTQIQGMENLVTDEVKDMSRMFMCCSSLQSIDLSHFSTGKVENMTSMFNNCIALTSLDLGSFDTQNVTKMSYMFTGCEGLESLNISSFNTANVTDMSNMFNNCWNLKSLDVSGFNTENVTNMSYMFAACSGLTALYVNSFTTRNVTDMTYMFYECSELTTILASSDWSKNAAPNVKSNGMFSSCGKILGGNGTQYSETNVSIEYARPDGVTGAGYFTPVPEFYTEFDEASATLTYYYDNQRAAHEGICETFFPMTNNNDHEHYVVRFEGYADKVKKAVIDESVGDFRFTALGSLFYGGREANRLSALETIEGLDNFDYTDVTSTYAMFKGCSSLIAVDLRALTKATKLKLMPFMFEDCSALKSIDLSGLNTFNPTDMSCMFEGCSSLESLDMTPLNTSKVESMINMFRDCSSLKSIDLSQFNTSNVTSMTRMFEGCSSLTSLDLSSFNTEELLWATNMFTGCSSLETLDLRSFNTSKVESMYSMFSGCTALTTLDLRSFTIEKLTEADFMFGGCTSLTTIYCNGDWTKSYILPRCENMFGGCTSLVGGYGSACDGMYYTDRTYARPDKGNGSGYFTAQKEVYTEFDASTSTLTYYCDTLRLTRSGITELYIPEHASRTRFRSYFEDVQYAVMDETMWSARLTSMRNMFYGGSEYDEDLNYEFQYKLSNLKKITGVGYFNTNQVTNMNSMFAYCSSLSSIDIRMFYIGNVTDMSNMFRGCTALTTIICDENWSKGNNIEQSKNMFEGCTSLVGGNGTKCDGKNYIDKTYARSDGVCDRKGYFTTVKQKPVFGLQDNYGLIGSIVVGETYDAKPVLYNHQNLPYTWSTSDPEALAVDENGVLTPLKDGVVTLKVHTDGNSEYTEAIGTLNISISYPLYLFYTEGPVGIKVTPENADDIMGDGKLKYNYATRTLIMKNWTFDMAERFALDPANEYIGSQIIFSYYEEPLTINLVGINTIKNCGELLTNCGNLVFTGSGSLTTYGNNLTISAWDQLTIDGPSLNINVFTNDLDSYQRYTLYGAFYTNRLRVINGGHLHAKVSTDVDLGQCGSCYTVGLVGSELEGDILTDHVIWSTDPANESNIYSYYQMFPDEYVGCFFNDEGSAILAREVEIGSEGPAITPLPDDETTVFDFSVYDPSGSQLLLFTLGAEDKYDSEKDRVNLATTSTAEEIEDKLGQALEGSVSLKNLLPGTLAFELKAGQGDIEIDCQTLPGYTLRVTIGEYGVAYIHSTIEQAERGKATISYNVSQRTYVVLYLEGASSSSPAPASAGIARSNKEEGAGAYIYAITVTPKSVPTENIEEIDFQSMKLESPRKVFLEGHVYILMPDGKIYDSRGIQVK